MGQNAELIAQQLIIHVNQKVAEYLLVYTNKSVYGWIESIKDEHDLVNRILHHRNKNNLSETRIKVLINPDEFLIIPKALFDKNNIAKAWNTVNNSTPEKLFQEYIDFINGFFVSNISNKLIKILENKHPEINISTHHKYIIESLSVLDYTTAFFVFKYDSKILLLSLKDNNLTFYNEFLITSPNDVAYYILSVFEQHNISPTSTVLLYDTVNTDFDEELSVLKSYIKNCNPLNLDLVANITRIQNKNNLISYNTISTLLCE